MSEGAPLRTATVASMAAEQQARKVEQLGARLAGLAQDGKSDARVVHLVRALDEELAVAKGAAAASDASHVTDELLP